MPDTEQLPQIPGLLGWVFGAIAAIGLSLSTVVITLYRKTESQNKERIEGLEATCDELQKHVDDCQRDRQELSVRCARNEARIEHMERELAILKKA